MWDLQTQPIGCALLLKCFRHNPALIYHSELSAMTKFFKIEQYFPLPLNDFRHVIVSKTIYFVRYYNNRKLTENWLEANVNVVQIQKTWFPRTQLIEIYQHRVVPQKLWKKGAPYSTKKLANWVNYYLKIMFSNAPNMSKPKDFKRRLCCVHSWLTASYIAIPIKDIYILIHCTSIDTDEILKFTYILTNHIKQYQSLKKQYIGKKYYSIVLTKINALLY